MGIAAIWDMRTDSAALNMGSASFVINHPAGPAIASKLFSPHVRTLDGLGPHGGNAHSVVKDGGRLRITEFVD